MSKPWYQRALDNVSNAVNNFSNGMYRLEEAFLNDDKDSLRMLEDNATKSLTHVGNSVMSFFLKTAKTVEQQGDALLNGEDGPLDRQINKAARTIVKAGEKAATLVSNDKRMEELGNNVVKRADKAVNDMNKVNTSSWSKPLKNSWDKVKKAFKGMSKNIKRALSSGSAHDKYKLTKPTKTSHSSQNWQKQGNQFNVDLSNNQSHQSPKPK